MVIEGGLKIAFQSHSVSDGNSLLEAEKSSILPSALDKMFSASGFDFVVL